MLEQNHVTAAARLSNTHITHKLVGQLMSKLIHFKMKNQEFLSSFCLYMSAL